ncbi:MAG: hypothetical protein L0Z73_00415 [Gammaproteobacteria bacterium]|nr:hypothetical protein [Gammaproteobacteria bacterium]
MTPKLNWLALPCLLLLAGCFFVRAPTAEELALLDNPPGYVRAKQDLLAPLALQWLNETEANLLDKGRLLPEADVSVARERWAM